MLSIERQVPQILRNKFYTHLPLMSRLTVLNLGSGSGGSVTEAFEETFLVGVAALPMLQQVNRFYSN